MINLADDAMTIKLDYELPEYPKFEEGYRRAPRRESHLTEADKALAIKNALRYIHPDHHEQMAKEFAQELEEHGRIYGYRFRPEGKLYGKPIDEYKGKCIEGKAIQVMTGNTQVSNEHTKTISDKMDESAVMLRKAAGTGQ